MNPLRKTFFAAALALSLLAPAHAGEATQWTSTWIASPQATWGADFVLPNNAPDRIGDQTIRQVARISVGGERVRIALSNAYGREPVTIGAAHIARSLGGSRIDAGSDRALTFGGRSSVTLLPGAPVLSDPVELSAPALAEVAVSLYVPQDTALRSFHWEGLRDAYLAQGDRSAQAALDGAATIPSRPYLSGIYVESARRARSVVAFGDSITDGAASTPNRNRRWPDALAERLAPRGIAVLNAGISGAQVLNDGMGVNALARFERDVLAQRPDSVVVLMGINDIGWPGSTFEPAREAMSAQRLIDGYRQLIARARQAGVRIVGATLTPFEDALPDAPVKHYFNPDKERVRQQVNAWIRSSGEFDAVADFDALLRDPAHPTRMRAAFDSGDRLHPGDAGYRAMADSLDEAVLFGAH
ncbi:SGNH/GDSL hydrolase family protein [Lysobacter enzymogenes]|uniref:GDSL-like lipase/acylhydrolase family protein n=1 Tax=Lysobacter enzymogenes TaxID=69 RepID=A0AAU9B043_LYSEN|nr:SGNH/GDSL hydrolase family protein [Lysobacter enzymogenes]BAV99121.1 GDSL-like lipase/acylhydrolase family protein [Lysobacter enzymogenes]